MEKGQYLQGSIATMRREMIRVRKGANCIDETEGGAKHPKVQHVMYSQSSTNETNDLEHRTNTNDGNRGASDMVWAGWSKACGNKRELEPDGYTRTRQCEEGSDGTDVSTKRD